MKNSLENIYKNTNLLILEFEKNNLFSEKERLEDAMSYACTFGEILSNIGLELKDIASNKEKYPKSCIDLVNIILVQINHFEIN